MNIRDACKHVKSELDLNTSARFSYYKYVINQQIYIG
jgi:hypothetical protein